MIRVGGGVIEVMMDVQESFLDVWFTGSRWGRDNQC
jgi:hypothetical protein